MPLDAPDLPVVPAIMPTSPASAVTKQSSYQCAFCYSVILTVLIGFIVNPTRLHEGILLCDQGMYITAARQYLDTGILQTTYWPSPQLAEGKRNFYYMPGYPVILAGVYSLFGYGVLQSLLPTALLFILCCMLCYHIGLKLYSSFAGWIAMILFSFYPFLHLFTLTAMSDVPVVASLLVSLAIFLQLSPRWQLIIGWTLPPLAFLFRETSAVVVFPMCAVILNRPQSSGRWKAVFCLLFTSLTAMAILYLSPISTTRDSLMFYNIIVYQNDPELIETQPLGSQQNPKREVFLHRVLERTVQNTLDLLKSLKLDIRSLEWMMILLAVPVGIWLFLRYQDYFMLSIAQAAFLMLLALVSLYVTSHIGKRHVLALVPLVSIMYGQIAALCIPVHWRNRFLGLLMVIIVPLTIFFVHNDWKTYHTIDKYFDTMQVELESIGHNDRTVLMTPYIAVSYSIEHYPVKLVGVSYTRAKLEAALATTNITTIVIPASIDGTFDKLTTKLTDGDLETLGFRLVRAIRVMDQNYQVYQRK